FRHPPVPPLFPYTTLFRSLQLVVGARVGERVHRLKVVNLGELVDRRAADALGRRVGRQQLGMGGLERAQLVEQRVVGVVADLGIDRKSTRLNSSHQIISYA